MSTCHVSIFATINRHTDCFLSVDIPPFLVVFLISPKEDRRRFMITAHDLGMTKGDYVFYTLDMLPDEEVSNTDKYMYIYISQWKQYISNCVFN